MKIKTKTISTKLGQMSRPKRLHFGRKRLESQKCKFRHSLLKAFQVWYLANKHRFLLPVFVSVRRDSWLLLSVGDIPPGYLGIYLGKEIMRSWVCESDLIWVGNKIDLTLWINSSGELSCDMDSRNYVCEMLYPVAKSRIELWQDHIFEKVLKTVNCIASAESVDFHFYSDGYVSMFLNGKSMPSGCSIGGKGVWMM